VTLKPPTIVDITLYGRKLDVAGSLSSCTENQTMKLQSYWLVSFLCLQTTCVYRVEQEECARLREGVPYVKVYRYNQKHLYPKLNGLGDNGN